MVNPCRAASASAPAANLTRRLAASRLPRSPGHDRPGQAHAPVPTPDAPGLARRATGALTPGAITTPAEFVRALRQFRTWAGKPSYRVMAARSRHVYAASTLHAALNSASLPGLEQARAIITGCHGTPAHHHAFAAAWRRIRLAPPPPPGT